MTTPPSEMIGKKAPLFSLKDQEGKTHNLADYRGRWVVLYTYPKDDTPGCTREACGFRDSMKGFSELGVVVLGMSILDTASKARFAEKFELDFPLLADEDHKVSEAYDVWKRKIMYGKPHMGVSRETFIIDPGGKIAMHWPQAEGSEGHSAVVLGWLKQNRR